MAYRVITIALFHSTWMVQCQSDNTFSVAPARPLNQSDLGLIFLDPLKVGCTGSHWIFSNPFQAGFMAWVWYISDSFLPFFIYWEAFFTLWKVFKIKLDCKDSFKLSLRKHIDFGLGQLSTGLTVDLIEWFVYYMSDTYFVALWVCRVSWLNDVYSWYICFAMLQKKLCYLLHCDMIMLQCMNLQVSCHVNYVNKNNLYLWNIRKLCIKLWKVWLVICMYVP